MPNKSQDTPLLYRVSRLLNWRGADKTRRSLRSGDFLHKQVEQQVEQDGPPVLLPRPNSRFSMLSVRTGKAQENAMERVLPKNVTIKLDCTNEDGIYRPGDTVQGSVTLERTDHEGKPLRTANVKIYGEAKFSRYEIEASATTGALRRVIRTKTAVFFQSDMKLFPHSTSLTSQHHHHQQQQQEMQVYTFALELPDRDASSPQIESSPHSSARIRKFAALPPSCRMERHADLPPPGDTSRRSYTPAALDALLHPAGKNAYCEIRYYLVVDVHWQRNLLQSRRSRAKIDIVVFPHPPPTASVQLTAEASAQVFRRSLHLDQSHRSHLSRSMISDRPSSHYLPSSHSAASSDAQSLPFRRPHSAHWPDASFGHQRTPSQSSYQQSHHSSAGLLAMDLLKSRELAVIGSYTGPRGWYIQRCQRNTADGADVLLEFFYPATPCIFMDEVMPFKLHVTSASNADGSGLRLQIKEIRFKLLRHVNVNSTCGKLNIERASEVDILGEDTIEVVRLDRKDTKPAPSDEYSATLVDVEACEIHTGQMKIRSGSREAQSSLEHARTISMSTAATRDVHIEQPGAMLITPSFYYRGLSVEYTVEIEVSMLQTRVDGAPSSRLDGQPLVVLQMETSPIKIHSRSAAAHSMATDASNSRAYDRIANSLSRPHPTTSSNPPLAHRNIGLPSRSSPHAVHRVPVPLLNSSLRSPVASTQTLRGESTTQEQVWNSDAPIDDSPSATSAVTAFEQEIELNGADADREVAAIAGIPERCPADTSTSLAVIGEEGGGGGGGESVDHTEAASAGSQSVSVLLPPSLMAETSEGPDAASSSSNALSPHSFQPSQSSNSGRTEATTTRARSSTVLSSFSQYSALTLDGLPPPYTSYAF